MNSDTFKILDQIQQLRVKLQEDRRHEKYCEDKIAEIQKDLDEQRLEITNHEAQMNALELNLRAVLSGQESPIQVPAPILDPVLDQVGREG